MTDTYIVQYIVFANSLSSFSALFQDKISSR